MEYSVRCLCAKCTWRGDTSYESASAAVKAAKALSADHGDSVHVVGLARAGAAFKCGTLVRTWTYEQFYLPGDPGEMELFNAIAQAARVG